MVIIPIHLNFIIRNAQIKTSALVVTSYTTPIIKERNVKRKLQLSVLDSTINKSNMSSSSHVLPTVQEDLREIHNLVQRNNWSPSVFKNNHRKQDNFVSCDILGIDVDDGLAVDSAIERLRAKRLAYSITFTTNHQKEKPTAPVLICDRYRIVITLSRRIENVNDFESTVAKIKVLFPESDFSCFEPARFFLASKGEVDDPDSPKYLNLDGLPFEVTEGKVAKNKPEKSKSGEFFEVAETGIPGDWNCSLNKAAFQLARVGFSKEYITGLCKRVAPEPLDHRDLATIQSACDGAASNDPPNLKGPRYFKVTFECLKIILADQIHFSEDRAGVKVTLEQISNGVVKYVSEERLISIISNTFYPTLLFDGPTKMKRVAENFKTLLPPISEDISPIEFNDSECLTFRRLDFSPESRPTPLFDELVSRVSNSQSFMAFIWSIFERKSERQQYLWLYGEGANGKGSVARLLERCLGEAFCSENTSGSINNRFYTMSFLGKRLAVFSDTNSRSFPTSSVFKELTGGDLIKMEPKGKATFTAKIHTKFMLLSNHLPKISSQLSDQRRAIICKLDPLDMDLDPQYDSNLWKERAGILYKCKIAYETVTKNHGQIKVDSTLSREIAEDNELPFQIVFDKCFKKEKVGVITPSDLYQIARPICLEQGVEYSSFKPWFMRQEGISSFRTQGESRKISGISLRNFPGEF
jgi:hypothetical protein